MLLNLLLLLLLTLSIKTDGYYFSMVHECTCSSEDLNDIEYIYKVYFNKELSVQFSSSVGKFIGFNELGVADAERRNSGNSLQFHRTLLDEVCKPGLNIMYSHFLNKKVRPKIRLRFQQEASGGPPAMMMCSAFNFYPPAIDVYWLRDGQKVTTNMISTEEMADGDWYYQVHSHLEYTPTSGEKISCVVEHASSKKPIIIDWEVSTLSEFEWNKIALGTSGLVLGLIFSSAGFIYYIYKKKFPGKIPVPRCVC
ncbi:H-2 class II histocompatibility antigen, E-S beta chain-like [Pygocentrus nattereri]|uniref:Ig-like domain-containing protein n=1 Tax=Pygocentrus nattereri TaxID=42514 RepID=A0A3B4DUD1_PYGNA|nr:H-2 class II histocompatibility antigen, E-S beta chain-like [Pygocentrus nattereri]